MDEVRPEHGSFRDRSATVFYRDHRVLRALTPAALLDWEALQATRLFRDFTRRGALIPTKRLDTPVEPPWAALLEHVRLPFVSYPYEWPFSMLRDAALLHLDLILAGLDEGIGLKDGSAYNVQWIGAAPVFVDLGSFYARQEQEPWLGYRQFCQMFLYPLLLQAYRGVPFQPWMRGELDGMDAATCLRLLSLRDYLRPGVLTHVYLQTKAQAAFQTTTRDVRADLKQAGFGTELIKANVSRLRRLISRLDWTPGESTWSRYVDCGHYESQDAEQKRLFVQEAVSRRKPGLVWDLGCNVGTFSRIAAEHAGYVVAMDADDLAVERLYRALRDERTTNILPLIVDVTDPSPNLGWRNLERKRLDERGRPDLTLALALIHHVVIGGNVRLPEFVQWLRDLGGELVIEFVTRQDPMVATLLRNKEDLYTDYDEALFERELNARFHVVRRQPLGSGTRVMYYAQPSDRIA